MMTSSRRAARTPNAPGHQLIRYGLVGIGTNLFGYAAYLLLTMWWPQPIGAMTVLYMIGATIGFIGNRHWTFAHTGALLPAGFRYCAAHCGGYLINLLLLFLFTERLGYAHQWVQAAAVFIVAGYLFIAFRIFVFPPSGNSRLADSK